MDKRRVLIVEDHDMTRAALLDLFRRIGWDVVAVGTVGEGLASLDPPPDCAVVDLMLPDGEGEAVVRTIKGRGLPTRVAVCTGTDDPARIQGVRALEPAGLIRKPIDVQGLMAVLNAAAD